MECEAGTGHSGYPYRQQPACHGRLRERCPSVGGERAHQQARRCCGPETSGSPDSILGEGVPADRIPSDPVALPELFSALQTGVVDSAEGPPSQMVSYNYNEVQDYLMMTSHNISVAMLLVSDSFLEGLTDDQRAIIDAAAKAGIAAGAAHTKSSNDAKVRSLIDAGMEQIHPDREAFMEAARPALEELFATEWSVTSWDEVMSYAR